MKWYFFKLYLQDRKLNLDWESDTVWLANPNQPKADQFSLPSPGTASSLFTAIINDAKKRLLIDIPITTEHKIITAIQEARNKKTPITGLVIRLLEQVTKEDKVISLPYRPIVWCEKEGQGSKQRSCVIVTRKAQVHIPQRDMLVAASLAMRDVQAVALDKGNRSNWVGELQATGQLQMSLA